MHGHGGILLETLKKMHLHLDLQAGDRLFWFTTTGWMMWNFLVGGCSREASIVLYDGNPGTPDLGVLWDLAEAGGHHLLRHERGLHRRAARRPACGRPRAATSRRCGRSARRARRSRPRGSPGSTSELGADIWLFSTSGGTDVCTAFVGGVPTLPVYQGELQARALGAAVEAWGPDGRPLVGEVGELVITEPMPSMPIYFWGDDGRLPLPRELLRDVPRRLAPRRLDRDHRPRHGDHPGRSDATINRGGIRMGTSEIYRAVLAVDEVVDALVVDIPLAGTDGWMPLFVVLREGARSTTSSSRGSARGCARTARRATFPT